jgi:hypothetical protein
MSNGRRYISEQLKYLHLHYLWVLYLYIQLQNSARINKLLFFVSCPEAQGGLNPLSNVLRMEAEEIGQEKISSSFGGWVHLKYLFNSAWNECALITSLEMDRTSQIFIFASFT